jgi:hypothetical protein
MNISITLAHRGHNHNAAFCLETFLGSGKLIVSYQLLVALDVRRIIRRISAVNTAGTGVLALGAIFRHKLEDKTNVGFALIADVRFFENSTQQIAQHKISPNLVCRYKCTNKGKNGSELISFTSFRLCV